MNSTSMPNENTISELAPIDPSSLVIPRGAAERATGMYSAYVRIASDGRNKVENQNAMGVY